MFQYKCFMLFGLLSLLVNLGAASYIDPESKFSGTLSTGQLTLGTFPVEIPPTSLRHVLAVTLRNDYSGEAGLVIYWTRSDDKSMDEKKKLFIPFSASPKWQTFAIPLSLFPEWKGKIEQIRLDVVARNGSTVEVRKAELLDAMPEGFRKVFPGSLQLTAQTGFETFRQGDETIDFTLQNEHGYTKPIPMIFPAEECPALEIVFKTEGESSASIIIYYTTLSDPEFSERQVARLQLAATGEWQTATLKPKWTGVIVSFRLDFLAEEETAVQIKSIEFLKGQ